MKRIKSYKNVRDFAVKGMGIDPYNAWLISFKVRLIKIIVETRVKRNMTQSELADLLGTSQPVVSRIESGSSKHLTIDYLLKVIAVLGVPPGKMLKLAA